MTEFSQTKWNELIEQYRNGTISDGDRFLLEKQALDDPFLFDALEGFSILRESEKKKATSRIFTLPRIAFAASLVLLIAVIFNFKSNLETQPDQDQSIAMVMETDKLEPSEIVEEELDDLSDQNPTSSTTRDKVIPINETNKPTKSKQTDVGENQKKEGNVVAIKEHTAANAQDQKVLEHSEELVEMDADVEEAVAEIKKDEVVINDNSAENKVDDMVAVQAPNKIVDVKNANSFEGATQESEVVLLDPNLNKRKEIAETERKSESSAYYEAIPIIGKEVFDEYANQSIDERGLRQENPQEVTIEFTIDKNGNLTDFRHIFKGCSECGSFAISILQKSGEWKTVPPGFSGKARWTFTF